MHPNTVIDYLPVTRKAFAFPPLALSTVTSRDNKSVYASSDKLYKGAVFGRDSLEVAEDLMEFKPRLVGNILLTLGSLQGLEANPVNEEEPGKIIHEYRTTRLNGRPIDKDSLAIFNQLAEKWGGTEKELAYYGSVDATPHFLRVLFNYCSRYGPRILDEPVKQRDGKTVTMRRVAQKCLEWCEVKLQSESEMIEYLKVNPDGLSNQVWKDSEEFYTHENGELANHSAGIASIEVQGIAFDAFQLASRYFADRQKEYTKRAQYLRYKVIDLLWREHSQYFALGTDYDNSGQLRSIETKTANPAALLDTGMFDSLPSEIREKYVSGITRTIMSPDFLTSAGIRSRALSAGHVVPFWDYHGSFVTWPKETYDIAKGLRRQGMPQLARQLENRLLNIIFKTLEYPEFIYVDEWGRALTGTPSKHQHGDVLVVEGVDAPERTQAWTVSAVYAVMFSRLRAKSVGALAKRKAEQQPWQANLEKDILGKIPQVNRFINPLSLMAKYPSYKYALRNPKHKL